MAGAVALYSGLDAFTEPWGVGHRQLRTTQVGLLVKTDAEALAARFDLDLPDFKMLTPTDQQRVEDLTHDAEAAVAVSTKLPEPRLLGDEEMRADVISDPQLMTEFFTD